MIKLLPTGAAKLSKRDEHITVIIRYEPSSIRKNKHEHSVSTRLNVGITSGQFPVRYGIS